MKHRRRRVWASRRWLAVRVRIFRAGENQKSLHIETAGGVRRARLVLFSLVCGAHRVVFVVCSFLFLVLFPL